MNLSHSQHLGRYVRHVASRRIVELVSYGNRHVNVILDGKALTLKVHEVEGINPDEELAMLQSSNHLSDSRPSATPP